MLISEEIVQFEFIVQGESVVTREWQRLIWLEVTMRIETPEGQSPPLPRTVRFDIIQLSAQLICSEPAEERRSNSFSEDQFVDV